MQRIYALLCVLLTPLVLFGAHNKKAARDDATPRIVAVNTSQNPIDMYVMTHKQVHAQNYAAMQKKAHGQGKNRPVLNTYARRSTTLQPGFEHDVMIEPSARPVAIILKGDFTENKPSVKLRGAWRMRQTKLIHKQHTGRVDMQSVPYYVKDLIQDIGNEQLVLLELNTNWLEKHPEATISMEITPEHVINITA